jgi:hypothetical protein
MSIDLVIRIRIRSTGTFPDPEAMKRIIKVIKLINKHDPQHLKNALLPTVPWESITVYLLNVPSIHFSFE